MLTQRVVPIQYRMYATVHKCYNFPLFNSINSMDILDNFTF